MKRRYMRWNVFMAGAMAVLGMMSCGGYKKNGSHQQVSNKNIEAGKQLAVEYCQSCHMLPDPSLLDAKSWEKGVLPSMGPMLGIFYHEFDQYPSYRSDPNLGRGFYPEQPVLNPEQWQHVLDYFSSLSPDTLNAGKNDVKINENLALFKVVSPQFRDSSPRISFLRIDTVLSRHTLMVYEVNDKSLFRFDHQLRLLDSVPAGASIVDMTAKDSEAVVSNMGIMSPNNGKFGTALKCIIDPAGKMRFDSLPLFEGLRRPVQITESDLNGDGKSDYLVCEYGNLRGMLSWFEGRGDKSFTKHVIREVPGAIKAWVKDYNHDGLPDIYAQFAQGDESIFLYTNKGNGEFDEKRLLRFPPSYGSTYFELADFNKDGFDDIIYTAGDNADYSPILKPYHGVYIFMNDGKNMFTQKYFFHINGCFKAMARDFDNDGDLDIAAISFFADYKNRPEEGFVYLENTGNLEFRPFSIPETQKERWLTMDAGDLDGDGRIDIVLGNFSAPEMIKSSVKHEKGMPFLLLKNMGK